MRRWWNRWFGDAGERAAARFLRRLGFKIVCRQYRNEFGELDLIAIDGDWLVFVEVNTRRSGHPRETAPINSHRPRIYQTTATRTFPLPI